jgi:hypothetical protein
MCSKNVSLIFIFPPEIGGRLHIVVEYRDINRILEMNTIIHSGGLNVSEKCF